MRRFELDEVQAKAILDMRLRALTGLEIEDLRKEFAEIEQSIRDLEAILADESKVMGLIKAELAEVREAYGDDRKTEIVIDTGELDIEDLIPNGEMVVMMLQRQLHQAPPSGHVQAAAPRRQAFWAWRPRRTTAWWTSSSPRRTTPSCSSPTGAGVPAQGLPHTGGRAHSRQPIVNLLPKLEEESENNLPWTAWGGRGPHVRHQERHREEDPLREYRNIRSNGIIAISLEEGLLVDTKLVHRTTR